MKFKLIIDKSREEEVIAIVHKENELTEKLENTVLEYTGDNTVTGYNEKGIKILSFSQIECITTIEGKTVAIDCDNSKYILKSRLYELEKVLPKNYFRINKSAIANKNKIDRFSASFNGAIDAVFKCGYSDYVSRRCFAEIKRRFIKK